MLLLSNYYYTFAKKKLLSFHEWLQEVWIDDATSIDFIKLWIASKDLKEEM